MSYTLEEQRERQREAKRRWKEAHPERYAQQNREYAARWRARNPGKHAEQNARWREANPEKRATYLAEWNRVNRDKKNNYENRRRASMQGDLTTEEWQEILWEFGHRCAYCQADGDLTQEHMTPISRGGTHSKANVVPACKQCNSSKGAKTLLEFAGKTPIKLRV